MTDGRQELPSNALERMFMLQHEVQQLYEHSTGVPTVPLTMTDEQRVVYIKDMFIALVDELSEYMKELRWKPWSSKKLYFNRAAAFGEAVDVFHFAMNLAMAAASDNVTPQDVARMLFAEYQAKNQENQRRAMEGYDGVTDKCPRCSRDLRDLIRHQAPLRLAEGNRVLCYCDEDVTEAINRIMAGAA